MEEDVRQVEAGDVAAAFQALLGRRPDDTAIGPFLDLGTLERVLRVILDSEEFRLGRPSSPFDHFSATFDARETMKRHSRADLQPTPGYLTNWLGVKVDPTFLPPWLHDKAGVLEPIPFPANWHADIAEWAAALRAVDLSGDTFTVAELGCGWGCWMNNTGVAARSAGRAVRLIGIEADEGHTAFARATCAANGFEGDQVRLHRGIAAASAGVALFPKQASSGENWGLEPIFGATDAQRAAAVSNGTFDELPLVPFPDIAPEGDRIDLLHIDIQGGELDFVRSCLEQLAGAVAYIVIGTHSRAIEGDLCRLLCGAGWRLEMERSAINTLTDGGPVVRVDGVQGWRNLRLLP